MLQLWFIANTLLWPIVIMLDGFQLGLNVVVLALAGAWWLGSKGRISGSAAKVLSVISVYILFSYFFAINGPCNDKLLKFVLSAPLLFFLILIGLEVGNRAKESDWLSLQKISAWVLTAAFLSFTIEALYPGIFPSFSAGYRSEGKYTGLFNEPSYVAFSLFPCIAILLSAETKQSQRKGLLALAGLILFSRSSTLFAIIGAWFLYRLCIHGKFRQFVLVVLGIALFYALAAGSIYDMYVAPTFDRIVGVMGASEESNISSLVYMQGWQDAWDNFLRTNGMGLGFNMMGCTPLPDVPAREILALRYGLDLNYEDGSFLFSKLVSETGAIAILFFIMIAWWWVRLEKEVYAYYRDVKNVKNHVVAVQTALIFSFVIPCFIRGTGYFSGGVLLGVVAAAGATKWYKDHRVNLPDANSGRMKIG